MNKQSGFVIPPVGITGYVIAGLSFALVISGFVIKWQDGKLDEYRLFAAGVEQVGKLALERKAEQEKEDKAKQEENDRENAKNLSRIADLSRRLRDERSRSSSVPEAPTGTSRPDLACFDRAELLRADAERREAVFGIAEACAAEVVNLDSGKAWVKSTSRLPNATANNEEPPLKSGGN